MNKYIYITLAVAAMLSCGACNKEEQNAPVDPLTDPVYTEGRDVEFTAEQLAFSSKRGVNQFFSLDDAAQAISQIDLLEVDWYLTGLPYLYTTQPQGVEFLPVAPFTTSINTFVNLMSESVEAEAVKRVVAFDPLSGDVTIDEALTKWAALESLKIPISTPVVDLNDATWFSAFMKRAVEAGLRFDYIAAEYVGSSDSLGEFLGALNRLHATYPDTPIIVTKFATNEESAAPLDMISIASFMQGAMRAMESMDFVAAYAWGAESETPTALTALVESDSSSDDDASGELTLELTELGRCYVDLTHVGSFL